MSINGVIVVNKEAGMTSFDVVYKIRKLAGTKKVGHTGTLDPDATGVLPVLIGNATRAADIMDKTEHKRYTATLRLGSATDTQDSSGCVVLEGDVSGVTEDKLKDAISHFVGDILQTPPMYSAIKVGGKKLYELARKGVEIEREKREIKIYSIDLLSFDGRDAVIDVKCSKGTYIRTLCHDIGEYMGCFGHMAKLCREESGSFKLSEAVTIEELKEGGLEKHLISTERLFSYPKFTLTKKQEYLVKNGVAAYCEGDEGKYRVYSEEGNFLCISEIKTIEGEKCLKLIKSFYGGNDERGSEKGKI